MMNLELDWAAPIVPGQSMMGLHLGMSYSDVLTALQFYRVDVSEGNNDFLVRIKNSPLLLVEMLSDGIILRDTISKSPNATSFDKLFVMGFKEGVLVHLMTSLIYGASFDYYKGLIFGKVGIGSPVANIRKFCEVEFDSGDELFYPIDDAFVGFSIGGSCSSLEEDPDQLVSYIRIYVSALNN
ncbi:hypothetical protein [Solimicrobium silvestre]|uniref:Uncharacterized protein n=1 Tax=Solimicrobium silvestre TaxID=2099400 RepID=A0A2S9GSG6_9BURK|nr:hypothetical protein [Solimicrobium silvestre]PRC90657.1 hypothetical protein S2091_4640 [Solimicrobium silvestre]